jgi:GNAT superfamily N-acetyltransferase
VDSRVRNVDYDARLGIVAERVAPGAGELIALARYEAIGDGAAEIAIVGRDDWQRRGQGARPLLTVVDAAERRGLTHLQACIATPPRARAALAAIARGPAQSIALHGGEGHTWPSVAVSCPASS